MALENTMTIWKEGDRVTVEDTLSFHEGETGTVLRVVGRWQYPVFVKFDDGNVSNFKHNELKKGK